MLASLGSLLLSLALVSVGAELLVRGAVILARRLRVSPFFIGLTIVGFGTSTPELFTSLIASRRGAADLAVGNVVGSNVFNIAFILGLASVLTPIPVRFAAVRPQVLWALAAALAPFAALGADGRIVPLVGGGLLTALAVYVALGYRAGRRDQGEGEGGDAPGGNRPEAAEWASSLPAAWVWVGPGPRPAGGRSRGPGRRGHRPGPAAGRLGARHRSHDRGGGGRRRRSSSPRSWPPGAASRTSPWATSSARMCSTCWGSWASPPCSRPRW